MAILNALMDDEVFHNLDDKQLRMLEARLTRALIASPEVHDAIASQIKPDDVLKLRG